MKSRLWRYLFFSLILSILAVFSVFGEQTEQTISEFLNPEKQPDNAFYEDKKHGWYWYEKELEPEENKASEKVLKLDRNIDLKIYTYDDLWNMYPDNFQELVELTKKKAVQYPTEDNVEDFMFLQDIARRKATAFASVFTYVAQKNHELTTKDVYPITKPGQRARVSNIMQEKKSTIVDSKKDFALIMFFSEDCSYCQAQIPILQYFTENFQWPVRMVNIDKNPAAAARFNISITPQIILVYKKTGDYMPISSGVISLSELKTKLYRSIKLMRGEITPQQWFLYEFEKNKSADPLKYVGKNVQIQ